MMDKKSRVIVVGADYHGDWAKDVCLTFRELGVPAELVFTNTVFKRVDNNNDVSKRARLEKVKQFFRQNARPFFNFVRERRRRMSERTLLREIHSSRKFGEALFVIFIWTPPSAEVLRNLKKMEGITLVLWQGEAPPRGPQWAPSFPYFDYIFSVDEDWLPLFAEDVRKRVCFLPLSSSSAKFFPLKAEEKDKRFAFDIGFIGYYAKVRAETLAPLKDHDIKIYGYWWESGMDEFPWLKEKYGGPLSNDDANQVFNAGKIQIGRMIDPSVPYSNTITQRVFDISLAGNFQLSGYSPAIKKIFGDSVPMFHNGEELKKLVDYYLVRPEERDRLAVKAHAIALNETYTNRIKTLIEVLGIA
jgi:hypothetical protein